MRGGASGLLHDVLRFVYARIRSAGDHVTMSRRRFALLAAFLVLLNLVLWLAPAGLAVRSALLSSLFGPRMIRAEVVVQGTGGTTQDYRVDRGVITSPFASNTSSITIRELDGTTMTIPIDATTRVTGPTKLVSLPLRKSLRVVVIRQANLPAQLIQVEGRG